MDTEEIFILNSKILSPLQEDLVWLVEWRENQLSSMFGLARLGQAPWPFLSRVRPKLK